MFPLEHDAEYMNNCMTNLIETGNFFIGPHIEHEILNEAIIRREEQ